MHTYPDLATEKLWKDECKRYAACLGIGILIIMGIGCFTSLILHVFA